MICHSSDGSSQWFPEMSERHCFTETSECDKEWYLILSEFWCIAFILIIMFFLAKAKPKKNALRCRAGGCMSLKKSKRYKSIVIFLLSQSPGRSLQQELVYPQHGVSTLSWEGTTLRVVTWRKKGQSSWSFQWPSLLLWRIKLLHHLARPSWAG